MEQPRPGANRVKVIYQGVLLAAARLERLDHILCSGDMVFVDTERLARSLSETLSGKQPLETLIAELRSHPELTIFDNKLQCHGAGAVECQYRYLADWMITHGRTLGADMIAANLSRYVSVDRIPYDEIMILAGVLVDRPIALSANVELLPFGSLRPSFLKELVARRVQESFPHYHPSAFLRRPVHYPREHLERDAKPPRSRYRWDFTFRALEDARLCMTAIGPSAPLWLSTWTQPAQWVPDLSGGFMQTPELFDMGGYPKEIARSWDELPELHRRWNALTETERIHLRVPLGRINSALRRREFVDAAIDLGIAVDALFLSEREPERGELGFTLRVRAARFLGKSEEQRREIAKIFSELFALRSTAVHTGNLSEKPEAIELLARGYELTGRAIRRIIREGEPDWRNIIFA